MRTHVGERRDRASPNWHRWNGSGCAGSPCGTPCTAGQVTPGACLARSRFVCGRAGCPTVGCHPALEDWEHGASADPARVATWWRDRPHGVLLPTGRAFDVLEVPAHLGRRVLDARARPTRPAPAYAARCW